MLFSLVAAVSKPPSLVCSMSTSYIILYYNEALEKHAIYTTHDAMPCHIMQDPLAKQFYKTYTHNIQKFEIVCWSIRLYAHTQLHSTQHNIQFYRMKAMDSSSIVDMIARFDEDVSDCEDDDYVRIPSRKTRSNILTPREAVKCNKTSKTHKLKPRSNKRDKTKMDDGKIKSKARRASHASDDSP